MNENSYQKLAELITKAPRLLGPGGLFGGLNQEHGLMVDFVKFARGLKLGNNMSPERVNIGSFVAYLGDRENAEEVGRKLYDMKRNGEIVEDLQSKDRNTLFNLAETLIDLGVGEQPENVGGDYEGVLSRAQSRSESAVGGRAEAPSEEKAEAKTKGPASGLQGATSQEVATLQGAMPQKTQGVTPQGTASAPSRDVASPETPLPTVGEDLTDQASIAGVKSQAAGLASASEAQADILAVGTEMETGQLSSVDQQQTPDVLPQITDEQATVRPEAGKPETEGLQTGRSEIYEEGALREPESFRIPQMPVTGRADNRTTGEGLAGTKATPGAERRHIAELPQGGRMLRKGPKKHGQKHGQVRGTGESGPDQARQTAPGRNSAQDFANLQAARPQKSRVGRRVAGGAGIAGSLALIKGMYGGAAANAATFGILQTILDLLT